MVGPLLDVEHVTSKTRREMSPRSRWSGRSPRSPPSYTGPSDSDALRAMTKVDGYRRTGRRLHAGPGLLRHHRAGQLRHGDVVDERHGNRRSACRRRRRWNGRSGSTRPRMRGGQCPGTRTSRQLPDRRRDGSPAPGSACSATRTPTAPGHLGRATDRRPERHSDPQATGSWAYRYDVRHEYRRFHLARIGRSHVSGAASDKTSWMFPHLSVGRLLYALHAYAL